MFGNLSGATYWKTASIWASERKSLASENGQLVFESHFLF